MSGLVIHKTIWLISGFGLMRGSLKCNTESESTVSSRVSKTWFRFSGTLCLLSNAIGVMLYLSGYQ